MREKDPKSAENLLKRLINKMVAGHGLSLEEASAMLRGPLQALSDECLVSA